LAIGVVHGKLIDLDLKSSGKCDSRFPSGSTQQNLHAWKTPEGIRLGSSVEDLFKAYGNPYRATHGDTPAKKVNESPSQIREGEFFYTGSVVGSANKDGNFVAPPFIWYGTFTISTGRVSRIDLQQIVYAGPSRLGPFASDREFSMRHIFKLLGPPPRSQPYCYRSERGDAFLNMVAIHSEPDVPGDVVLTDFPSCVHMPVKVVTSDLREWKTPEGIGLGSSEEEVVRAYGKPSREFTLPIPKYLELYRPLLNGYREGDRLPDMAVWVLRYVGAELSSVDFRIRKGKVSYIWWSDNE
jgi:hypothetical protein